jgi:FecR protein
MNRFRTWPHLAIIGVVCLVLGAGAAVLWSKHEQTAEASALPNAARLDRVSGEVALSRTLNSNNAANTQWVNATQNTPVSVGDRIYTKDNADASIAFSGRNFARLNADTSLDVLAMSNDKTQVALREGSAVFDIGNLPSSQLFEVATPCGAVDLTEQGLYQLEIDQNGNATATTLSGAAQVVGQGGTGKIGKGEVLTVPCQGATTGATLSRVEPRAAGALVDRYYRYRYPRTYDGRYVNYDAYMADPFYYDPYQRFASYKYVSDYVPGIDDLDYYGDWVDVSNYGYCWRPRVDYGWAPYQAGYWSTDYPFGLTWISSEPWGYAPYHYGRWTFASNTWFWIPESVRTVPVYSPALVAYVPFGQSDVIGWVPLGPGDPYTSFYYDPNWTPRYLTGTQVVQERVVNLNVPGAVTVVNFRDFNRVIDPRVITRVDERQFAKVRPVLDPFAVRNFRDVALRTREQRRIDVPAAVAQRIDRPVMASTMPVTPFRKDLAQRLHTEAVPEKARGERLQFRDNRQAARAANQPAANQPNVAAEQARERQMAELAREAARGNKGARQQMQQLQQQQRQEQQQQRQQVAEQQRAQRTAQQQAQGERVSNVLTRKGERQPPQPQAPQTTRGRHYEMGRATPPRANQQPQMRQPKAPRQVQRPQPPQAQPRVRMMGPPVKQPANRPQSQRPQAAPHPRTVKPQPAQPQPRSQPRPPAPQAKQAPAQTRQQSPPKAQPQPHPQPQPKPQQKKPPA